MWKAIGWGFAGLVLGVIVGGAVGAVLGTLAGSAGGVLHWGLHHGEHVVCEPRSRAHVPAGAVAAVVVVAVCVWASSALAPFWAALCVVVLAVDAAGVVVLLHLLRARRPRRVRVAVRTPVAGARVLVHAEVVRAEVVRAPYKIPAPVKAISGRPVAAATVLASDYERQAVR